MRTFHTVTWVTWASFLSIVCELGAVGEVLRTEEGGRR